MGNAQLHSDVIMQLQSTTACNPLPPLRLLTAALTVTASEIERMYHRFTKLDRERTGSITKVQPINPHAQQLTCSRFRLNFCRYPRYAPLTFNPPLDPQSPARTAYTTACGLLLVPTACGLLLVRGAATTAGATRITGWAVVSEYPV